MGTPVKRPTPRRPLHANDSVSSSSSSKKTWGFNPEPETFNSGGYQQIVVAFWAPASGITLDLQLIQVPQWQNPHLEELVVFTSCLWHIHASLKSNSSICKAANQSIPVGQGAHAERRVGNEYPLRGRFDYGSYGQ